VRRDFRGFRCALNDGLEGGINTCEEGTGGGGGGDVKSRASRDVMIPTPA